MVSGGVHWRVLSPDLLYLGRQQPGNLVGINQKLDRSGLTRCPADVAHLLQLQDHLMYRRWGGPEEPLQIPLRRRPSEHHCVVVNEGQVLALLRC